MQHHVIYVYTGCMSALAYVLCFCFGAAVSTRDLQSLFAAINLYFQSRTKKEKGKLHIASSCNGNYGCLIYITAVLNLENDQQGCVESRHNILEALHGNSRTGNVRHTSSLRP